MSRRPPASDDTEPGLLRRWSHRKQGAVRAGDASDAAAGEGGRALDEDFVQAPEADRAGVDAEPDTTEQVKTDADMPDLETINDASDVSDFLSPGVSEKLRNAALRRLFRTAKFNVVDVMDDYNEDFRNFQPLGDLVTADMRHRMEMEEKRRQEAVAESGETRDGEPVETESVKETNGREKQSERAALDTDSDQSAEAVEAETDPDSNDPPSRTST
jgi:hypothetical protein